MSELRQKTYSTSEVMKAFGLGRNTLRLYEEMGLLIGMTRTESGYREYSTKHIGDLKFILEAKRVGFTLNEIKELLGIVRTQKKITCGTVSSEISQKIEAIDEEVRTLEAKKQFLGDFLKTCGSKNRDAHCDVMSAGFKQSACCS